MNAQKKSKVNRYFGKSHIFGGFFLFQERVVLPYREKKVPVNWPIHPSIRKTIF